MTPASDTHVAVTREGAAAALKLMMVVLAAFIFWQSAAAINAELRTAGLVTAPAFMKGAARLLVGTETTGAFPERLLAFWHSNHHLIALIATTAIVALFTVRYLILGRVMDFLYLESPVSDRRIYSGFVANIFLVLVHAGIIFGIVLVFRGGRAAVVPLMLLAFFIFNLLWSLGILLTSRKMERKALRGMKYLALTSGAAMAILFFCSWAIESARPASELRNSQLTVLGAVIALAVCVADAIIQTKIYCSRKRAEPVSE